MKRPQPDISESLKNDFIGNLKTVRGLLRLWGTEMIDGVEVFTPRQFYYKEADRSENFEKLFKFLGAYEDVIGNNYEGIKNAWLYFNKNNETELQGDNESFVSDNLNKMWWDDNDGVRPENLTLTTSIVIEAYNKNSSLNDTIQQIVNTSMSKEVAINSIINNYEQLWNLCRITQEGVGVINKGSITDSVNNILIPDEDDLTADDPWLNTIARYALRDQGIPCTVKDLSIGTAQRAGFPNTQEFFTTFVLDIEIPYKEFFFNEFIVEEISRDINNSRFLTEFVNPSITSSVIRAMDYRDLEDDPNVITRNYLLWEDQLTVGNNLSNVLWFNYYGFWYLKAEPFRNPRAFGLKFKDLTNYVLRLLENGYKKESVPWYKKAIAVILVVVAIVITVISAGNASGVAAKLLVIAGGILATSLALTLAILAFSVLGMAEWASAFMSVSKAIEPAVMIASIVFVVVGVYQAVQLAQAAQEVAKKAAQEASKSFVERSTFELLLDIVQTQVQSIIDDILKGAVDVFSGNFMSDVALEFTAKLFKVANIGLEIKLKSLQDRNTDLKLEYDKLKEEMGRETDTLQGFMKIYSKPATADWSTYASQFDMPYERGGGFLALGNIQRTTKQAMRKADYNDSAFADILVI